VTLSLGSLKNWLPRVVLFWADFISVRTLGTLGENGKGFASVTFSLFHLFSNNCRL